MSRKRHYERFTNRALPPLHEGTHYWFNSRKEGDSAQGNWDSILSTVEQTRSEYIRKLKANPDMDRNETQLKYMHPEGEESTINPYWLDRYIQAMEQSLKLPVMPDNPTPDQLQEALTQLSEVLKPQPYQKQPPDEQQQQGEGEGDGGEGEGDGEDEEDDEKKGQNSGEGKEGKEKEQKEKEKPPKQPPKQPPKPPKKPPEKPQGRPKKPEQAKQQQKQVKQQQQQVPAAPQERPDEDVTEQKYTETADVPDMPKRKQPASGGGDQTYSSPEDIAFMQARNAIINLCVAKTPLERPELGDEPYNLRRVVKSAYNPAMLTSIRDENGKTVDDVYLLLDTSGSVSHYAPLIASVAAAAAGIVHIYTGTEARPHFKVVRSSPLANAHDSFPEWKAQVPMHSDREIFRDFVHEYQAVVHKGYPSSELSVTFEAEMAWMLQREQPPRGSHIIIWTDTEGCGIHNPLALRALLSDYKVTLMMPGTREEVAGELRGYASNMGVKLSREDDPITAAVETGLEVTDNGYRMYCEVFKFLAIEIPVIYGVTDGVTFAQALRQL